jgi:hypothetical protein
MPNKRIRKKQAKKRADLMCKLLTEKLSTLEGREFLGRSLSDWVRQKMREDSWDHQIRSAMADNGELLVVGVPSHLGKFPMRQDLPVIIEPRIGIGVGNIKSLKKIKMED